MIEAVVKSALQTAELMALWSTRVWPDTIMQSDGGYPQFPAGCYLVVDAVNAPTICGTDDQSTDDSRVQVDIYATSLATVLQILDLVIESMMATDPPCTREDVRSIPFDPDTRTYGRSVDFVFNPSSEETS